ncbi:MAG: NADH-quinone oxidoreductase subunit L [Chloroflexi bacterium]|nr:NADH-quinone oxidoreductase subunit L [Chloroflexota bacterium]MDA1239963.1 NADH-quinone oxidoreductase subunit L [Chloroflexota bacterium]MQC25424.1 NADH-quinone oxidoreductase subunit L [Chloroflexota bacterium]MQC48210.1 NADH-quinone oxidoreductase subunit L [Chloroflexota bacterium]
MLPDIPQAAVWAIYFAPITSFLVIVALLRDRPLQAGRFTILAIGVAWLLSVWALDTTIGHDGEALAWGTHHWFSLFNFEVSFGIRLDGLSGVMIFVVTSISLLVQVYSTGYMSGDGGYSRFFALMSLFTAAMLGLVMASSLLQLFIHWELVGLTSYLLIGFWFHRPSAAAAAKKAFIVTRFGDFGFMLALVLIWSKTGTFDIAEINALAQDGLSAAVLTGFVLGLFAGAAGKSAQFPLHFWLPDAMEGPTPVSSIVHSATMVAAGVYLLARMFPAVDASPGEVQTTIAYIGGFTAIFAATMGVVATDIKRVLAYSTISQLGYMVMAIGLGGYVAAIFHLFTHAFFKSLLFQGAGSVSHATNTFEMPLMGGLRKVMPVTFITFLIGSLSLAGVFPLAGFWSKDEILLDAYNHDKILWVVGTAVAFLTALYMFRAIFMTFFGEYRGGAKPEHGGHDAHDDAHGHGGPHESPRSMLIPLIALSIPAILFGLVAPSGFFGELVEGALPEAMRHFHFHANVVVVVTSTVAALGGIAVAAAIYYAGKPQSSVIRAKFGPLAPVVERLYYVNEVAEDGIVRGALYNGAARGAALFDKYVVDMAVNMVGTVTQFTGSILRRTITGQVQSYTSIFILGVVGAAGALLVLSGGLLDRLVP